MFRDTYEILAELYTSPYHGIIHNQIFSKTKDGHIFILSTMNTTANEKKNST